MHSTDRLYSNTALLHPDGSILCYVDARKAEWYLRKGLGKKHGDNAVQLLFKPAGRGASRVPFMIEPKENICVACGKTKDLTQHHVVPLRYRKLLPLRAKRHGSYDVLGLCSDCHRKYEDAAVQRKFQRRLKRMFRTRFFRSLMFDDFCVASGAARSLHKYGDRIPANRRRVLRLRIAKYLGRWPSEKDILLLGTKKPAGTAGAAVGGTVRRSRSRGGSRRTVRSPGSSVRGVAISSRS